MTLWEQLVNDEGAIPEIYPDHHGIPTIGVGYNLRNEDVLRLVLQQFGYTADSLPNGDFVNFFGAVRDIFRRDNWRTHKTANRQDVQNTLNQYRAMMVPADSAAASPTFAFQNTAQMQPVFETVRQDYANQIVARISSQAGVRRDQAQAIWDGLPENMQDPLLSLAFNGGATAMIGPKIAGALRDARWHCNPPIFNRLIK